MATDKRKTPVFDWATGDFLADFQRGVVLATGSKAAEQVIIKAQQTRRGIFLIYADVENPALNHKYGSDVHDIAVRQDISDEVRISEIKRAVREALIFDAWIEDVTDIEVYKERDTDGVLKDFVKYNVKTIYDNVSVEGVAVNE